MTWNHPEKDDCLHLEQRHVLETLVVELRGKGGGQEELKVGDGLLHGDIKGTHQRPPLIQHFCSGIFWEIPENKETIESALNCSFKAY